MVYGTLRIRNLKASKIKSCEQHNRRLYAPEEMPKNINPEKAQLNEGHIFNDKLNFTEAINTRLEGISVRKNSVVAIEFVMGASKDFYKGTRSAKEYLAHCFKFVSQRYGSENIVCFNLHFDETNPHIHILVTPVSEKTVRWKNQRGQGIKKEKRLCARDIIGGRPKLQDLQEDFYKFIVPFGKKAGVEFMPRVRAEDQAKQYTKFTDYRMAEINRIAEQAQLAVDAAQRLELQRQILVHKEELDKVLQKKGEAEEKTAYFKKRNRGMGM